MHHSGPLPLTFESPEQGFGSKNYQNGSQGEPNVYLFFIFAFILHLPINYWFVTGALFYLFMTYFLGYR